MNDRHQPGMKKWTLECQFSFDAAHQLLQSVPLGHPCGRLHGHRWNVGVRLRSVELVDDMVCDFSIVKAAGMTSVHKYLDHRNLNEQLVGLETTAERLAEWIYDQMRNGLTDVSNAVVDSVWVEETPGNRVTFEGSY